MIFSNLNKHDISYNLRLIDSTTTNTTDATIIIVKYLFFQRNINVCSFLFFSFFFYFSFNLNSIKKFKRLARVNSSVFNN